MAELQVKQVECANCGSKIDIRSGLRMKTFTCEYCGAVCDNDEVVALQNQQEIREKFRPLSFLKLGLKCKFLDQEYQIVGRVRLEGKDDEESWFWDEWFLMSPTGYPLWINEDETGYSLFMPYVSKTFLDPYSPSSSQVIEKVTFKEKERGLSTIIFIEGELTWKARPQEVSSYIDYQSKYELFSIDYTQYEIQYLRGKILTNQDLKNAFGDIVPADTKEPEVPKPSKKSSFSWKLWGVILLFSGIFALFFSFKIGNYGSVVYDRTYRDVKVAPGEFEFSVKKFGESKPLTFSLKKASITKFTFKTGYFPYGSGYKKESGWWLNCALYEVVEGGDDKLITIFNTDFWRAEGYDEGEHWSESKRSETFYLKGLKSDKKYYFIYTAGANSSNGLSYRSNVKMTTTVVDGAWNPKPLRYTSFFIMGLALLFLIIGFNSSKK